MAAWRRSELTEQDPGRSLFRPSRLSGFVAAKRSFSPRMCYPGYVLVEMDMDDYTWHVIPFDAPRHGFCRFRADAFAARYRRGSAKYSEPCHDNGGEAKAETIV